MSERNRINDISYDEFRKYDDEFSSSSSEDFLENGPSSPTKVASATTAKSSSDYNHQVDVRSSPSSPSEVTKAASALLISASDKAGMKGIDREKINAILLRESGNSTFMQRQKKLDENTNRKIQQMKQRISEKDETSSHAVSSATKSNIIDWRKQLRQSTIDPLLSKYESQRRPISTCVVIDMDGFFISCHILDHPHLASIPACVGGSSMISTSNYVARQYGVRAAMPGYLGSILVKELSGGKETLTFVRSDFALYKKKSSEVRAVLEEYDPNLKMYSLDEAYMDIGPYLAILLSDDQGRLSHEDIRKMLLNKTNNTPNNSSPAEVAQGCFSKENKDPEGGGDNDGDHSSPKQQQQQGIRDDVHVILQSHLTIHTEAQTLLNSIREQVKATTGLTCSAGLASNFLLAKIASDFNKPNGQHFVGPSQQQISDFISPLPTRKVNGIGRVMEKMLRGVCGIETIQDLYDKRAEVYFLMKPASAQFLMRASIGYSECGKHRESTDEEDNGSNDNQDEALHRKGISHERTFPPTSSWTDLCSKLETITLSLVQDLKKRNLRPKTVTLKVKLSNFDMLTRATTRNIALSFQDQGRNHQRQCQNSPGELVDIVINLLKEAKRAHLINGDKTAGKSKKKHEESAAKKTWTTTPFAVRLLGVRCSNFQLEKDNQSSLDQYRLKRNSTNKDYMKDYDSATNLPQFAVSNNNDLNDNKGSSRALMTNPYLSPETIKSNVKVSTVLTKNPYLSPKTNPSNENVPTDANESKKASPTTSARRISLHHVAVSSVDNPRLGKLTQVSTTTAAAVSTSPANSTISQCPLCNKQFQTDKYDNTSINAHIDSCLNASTVKQLAKEETISADERGAKQKKRRRLTDFFNSE